MRTLALILLLAVWSVPAIAARRVTVEQLEQTLATLHGRQDADAAWQIAGLELSERLSDARLRQLQDDLPGEKSRQALLALADESAFLNPPTAEVPATPPPDVTTQRRIMGLVVEYMSKTIPRLPNFFATRTTTLFQDTPQVQRVDGVTPYQPLHGVGVTSATILYRGSRELVDTGESKKPPPATQGLSTYGVFGPILGTVLLDAAQSKLVWSHWEQHAVGQLAVFAFAVPKEKSHYAINYCCVAAQATTPAAEMLPFRKVVSYRGEMAVDPATGAILRLMVQADLQPSDPVVKADILVVYGAVDIGGKTYFCPQKSIARAMAQTHQFDPTYNYAVAHQMQPLQTSVNDAVFEQYHMFRTDMRILTENEGSPAAAMPAAGAAESAAAVPAANGSPTAGETAMTGTGTAASPETATATPAPAAPAAPAPPVIPEMSVADATGLPDLPTNAAPTEAGSGFTLHTTARLVDVGVVAFDKKGHPVTDLKPDDFEIYDNGQKQTVRFLSQAGAAPAPTQQPTDMTPAQIFTNHLAEAARDATPSQTDTGTTVLLMDASSLAWGDLTYARSEALRFLKALPADERVGLYAMRLNSFDVLQEPTVDHAQVATRLAKWIPDAQALAEAQDAEQRNRQQIEWVHSIGDLAYVNGNANRDPATFGNSGGGAPTTAATTPIDPQLQDLGSNPEAVALAKLLGVARHMAALPGHKSLVWIASDNVLADWSNATMRSEKTAKYLAPIAIDVQEALNNAHVSIYPLDASQLEAGGIGADIGTRNVLVIGRSDRDAATAVMGDAGGSLSPGRETAQMQQDLHPVQGIFRDVATATGGRVFRRSGDIARELTDVVEDGRAAYLLSFSPSAPADDKYHTLTVKLPGRRNVRLRYRTGYLYSKAPAGMKDRFREAVWQAKDANEIGLTAEPVAASNQWTLKLGIAATDLQMAQQGGRWMDKLDIFLVKRDDGVQKAQVTGKTLGLRLKPETYQKALRDGIPFEEPLEMASGAGSLRVMVVDENSGRIGSVTIPGARFGGRN
ncbi:MAG: VWA domain-containing protein [Acidobacteriota bacterium]|nr:VWA domain-containing protein [Acidobacteriota bacterium]